MTVHPVHLAQEKRTEPLRPQALSSAELARDSVRERVSPPALRKLWTHQPVLCSWAVQRLRC